MLLSTGTRASELLSKLPVRKTLISAVQNANFEAGIVGSDPYLAPEVYDNGKYDPQCVDVWSMAIIYCCMSLRRFPWKAPRQSDKSYAMFAKIPEPGKPGYEELRKLEAGDLSQRASNSSTDDRSKEPPPSDQIYGPWRLLRLLPRESRQIVGGMLELDPAKRVTLAEVVATSWVQNTPTCQQDPGGRVVRAEGHDHILEPGAAAAPDPSKK